MSIFFSEFANLFTPLYLALIIFGVTIGIVFGSVPGLSPSMCIALFLPMSFSMDLYHSMALFMGIYVGGVSGGLISAILINVPGTTASLTTCFDGHPLAKQGKAGKALGVGITFSFIGSMIGYVAMIIIAPQLVKIAIEFGNFEFFAVAFFALTMIITMSSTGLIKGLISGFLGALFAMVGMAPLGTRPRFTFGCALLNTGFDTVPVMVGLFAISELFILATTKEFKVGGNAEKFTRHGLGFSMQEFLSEKWNCLRSAVYGIFFGILPGIGGTLAAIVAYDSAKRFSKKPEEYGKGAIGGIVASETANNASIGGAMIPLLTLGIPGDAVTAILLGAFTMKGLQPGPIVYMQNINLMYFIYAALILATISMFIIEFFAIRQFVKIISIPKNFLFTAIAMICVASCYCINNRMADVFTLIGFGFLGFLMRRWAIPLQPFILGFILWPMAELNFRRALSYSDGSFLPFFTNPISCVLLVLSVASIVWGVYSSNKKRKAAGL